MEKKRRRKKGERGERKRQGNLTTVRSAKEKCQQELKLKPNRSKAVFEGFIICFAKEAKNPKPLPKNPQNNPKKFYHLISVIVVVVK